MSERKRPEVWYGDGGNQGRRVRRCVTMDKHWSLVRKDPEYRWRRRQLEAEIQDWIRLYGGRGLRTGLIRIPVVVHVIYNTAAQNISDAQIHSQIDVLNADYRRLNADAASTPAAFAGVAADARLEFALAVRDPNCNATTGITRTSTSVSGWVYPGEGMKATASGGQNPWNVDKYLNIWVVNYMDSTLGYGTFPGMPANIQGVVCHYQAFGNTGTLESIYNLGRTMTHEIGHWLNLNHIWGDDGIACTGSDNVDDTPNQAGFTSGCPGFPHVSCSNGPNGDMFMNYMDYSDDNCMNTFTAGQVARMDAALHTARATILASDGLVPPAGAPGPDLWSQDVSDDFGAEPDPSIQPMWISDDIWVRTSNDGLMNQDHENPEYRPPGSPSNYVYVRVRNRACGGTASGTLRLYWAKASSGLAWPSPWDGSVTMPVLMGNPIGSQSVSVAGGTDEILTFPWMPPNPADYAIFGADQGHFCLLARIETSATAPFGMTFPETSNLYANVQNNNNIVWKNVTVVDEVPGSGRISTILIANFRDEVERATLVFQIPKRERPSIFDWGEVLVDLPRGLTKDRECEDALHVRQLNERTFQLLQTGARLGTFELAPGEIHGVRVRLLPMHQKPLGVRNFTLDLLQKVDDRIVGGQRLILKGLPDRRFIAIDNASLVFDGVSWVPGGGGHCGCSCK
jgi:hypothetical protein